MKIEISKHWTKRREIVSYTKHNYTTEYLNIIKVNNGIKTVAVIEISYGYALAMVNKTLQEVK